MKTLPRFESKVRTHRTRLNPLIGLLAATVGCALLSPLHAETVVEHLYAGSAPGSEHWKEGEVTLTSPSGAVTYKNVSDPTLTVYAPESPPPGGTGLILLPGGGLRVLGVDSDTRAVIATLNTHGITVFLLKYRVLQQALDAAAASPSGAPAKAGPPSFPKVTIHNANANPAPDDAALSEVLSLAAGDMQVALRRVRAEASRWHLNPAHVGALGYSAGGGVALAAETLGERGARPDFIATAFGPSLMDVHVAADAPALFIATETNHGPVTDGLLALTGLWHEAGRPVELHMYDVPAFKMPSTLWLSRFLDWLGEHRLLPA
jgi:acetyl esterase/lipase